MYSFTSSVDPKRDGLVNETTSKARRNNPGADVDGND